MTTDPDKAAADDEKARFRGTTTMAAAGLVLTAAASFILSWLTDHELAEAAKAAAGAGILFAGVLNVVSLFVVDFRPDFARRLALSRGSSGDERERRIASDTTVRIYTATNLVVAMYAVFVAKEWAFVWIILIGTLVEPVVTQIRTRRP